MPSNLFHWLRVTAFRIKFHRKHKTHLRPNNVFDLNKILSVGEHSYGGLTVATYNNPSEGLIIGDYVSIGAEVLFQLGGNHSLDTVTSYPIKTKLLRNQIDVASTKGYIIVEDDVWIGSRATILSGVTISQGAVVAAGSVVTKNVAPYAIVGGNPARLIRYRFEPKVIERLREVVKYSQLTPDMIERNLELFYLPVDDDVLDRLSKVFQ